MHVAMFQCRKFGFFRPVLDAIATAAATAGFRQMRGPALFNPFCAAKGLNPNDED